MWPKRRILIPVCCLTCAFIAALASAQTPNDLTPSLLTRRAAPPSVSNSAELPPALQKRQVTLQAKSVTLDEIVAEVARQTGCNIIVNDHPNHAATDIDLRGSLPKVLAAIGSQFDYEYKVSKSGVVLFTKRFKDANEYPNLSCKELARVAGDMIRPVSAIYLDPGDLRDSDLVAQFNRSLTSAQAAQMKGDSPIYVRDLSRDQQGLIRERIYRTLFSGLGEQWREMMQFFELLPNSSLRLDTVTFHIVSRQGSASHGEPNPTSPPFVGYRLNLDLQDDKNGRRYPIVLYEPPHETNLPDLNLGDEAARAPGRAAHP